jgi:hypothetical protein
MKHIISILLSAWIATGVLLAQDHEVVRCVTELNKTEVLAGHTIQVTFTLENVQNARFTPPQWPAQLEVVYGPSQSSQVQVVNGVVSAKQSWTYGLRVRDAGQVDVPEAVFAAGEKTWHTEKKTITVKPNPDGIEETKEKPAVTRRQYDFWGNPIPEKPTQPAKPKRPTVRI